MDYEQKYKEALGWMKSLYGGLHGKTKEEAEKYFPELKESKDEWIRKMCMRYLDREYQHCSFADDKKNIEKCIAWLEKQGQEKHLSEPIKDYQGSFTCWNNAHDFRPKHLQRCICYDKYMGGVYCYVYDDISKYWCTQTTEEHDSDGDNHISDYADYRITLWMPLPDTSFYPSKSLLEKQGEQETDEWKEGNIIRHGGILALVIRGRRVMKSNGEIFTVQYPDEWVKAAPKEIEHFLNEFEKQGEQPQGKSALEAAKEEKVDNANKVEPKFHEGEWIVDSQGFTHQIERVVENVTTHTFGYDIVGGGYFNEDNKNIHLWTIQDAKDGDVLASGHLVFIFKVIHGVWLNCHCSVHNDGSFIADSYDLMTNKYFSEVHPATKEQCDLLFKKMHETGYEWDENKKELRKIEQKSKWSEEDESKVKDVIYFLDTAKVHYASTKALDDCIDWLKSLKQRMEEE